MDIEKNIKVLHHAEDLELGSIQILNEIKAAYRNIEQERDQYKADADKFLEQLHDVGCKLINANNEIESLRAQLKAAKEQAPVGYAHPKAIEKMKQYSYGQLIFKDKSNKEATDVALYTAPIPAQEENPTELEMHRADYNAIIAAGFESPGELLAAYKVLEDKIKAVQEQGAAGMVVEVNPNRKECIVSWINGKYKVGDKFYAAPVPAQQSPAVAVPPSFYVMPDGLGFDGYASLYSNKDECPDAIPVWTSQQPVAVVPDGWKLVPVVLTHEMAEAFNIAEESYQYGIGIAPDCHWAAMISASPLPPVATSSRITEQGAREIINSFKHWWSMPNLKVPGIVRNHDTEVFPVYMDDEGRALLDKLNQKGE